MIDFGFELFLLITDGSFVCTLLLLVFRRYDPNFMAASLDEAYLDITEVCKERNVKSEEVSWYIGLNWQ